MNLLKTNSNNDGGVNIPFSNSLIKDKLEEIFVVFGMIFNEEQFFMKFKNNIFQLNSIVQDNSLPNFRVIRILMDEFEKIMKNQEKEMLLTITTFYYFLYKNFISLIDNSLLSNKIFPPSIPTMINNNYNNPNSYLSTSFPPSNFHFQGLPLNNIFTNFNKSYLKMTKNPSKSNIDQNKYKKENSSPNKCGEVAQEISDSNKISSENKLIEKISSDYKLLGKKHLKENDSEINSEQNNTKHKNFDERTKDNESKETHTQIEEIVNHKKDYLILDFDKKENQEPRIKESKYEVKEPKNSEKEIFIDDIQKSNNISSKGLEKIIVPNESENIINLELHINEKAINSSEGKSKEVIILIDQPKLELKGKEVEKKEIINKNYKEQEINGWNINDGNEEYDKNMEKMIFDLEGESESENLSKDKEFFEQQYKSLTNNISNKEILEDKIDFELKDIIQNIALIKDENMKIMKTGEITNKEEMEMIKKIIHSDYINEYKRCFHRSKTSKDIFMFFITRIKNIKGVNYILKYNKEAYEFNVFEYLNKK